MNDNLKLIITVLPEIIVFMGIGLFIKATKKLEVLTIPGLNVYNLSEQERFLLILFLWECCVLQVF